MPNLETDQRFLQSGIPVLSEYLLSKELLYPLEADLPRLTLGNVRLAQFRLEASGKDKFSAQIDEIRKKWQRAWEQKAVREIHMRYELWRDYLAEYRSSPEGHASRYPAEIRNRVILQLLSSDAPGTPELELLPGLDSQLRGRLEPGSFVWEKEVESGFDKLMFWFLFGNLKSSNH